MNELSLDICAKNLGKHGFEVEIVSSLEEAGNRLREEIEKIHPQTVSYGDSITVRKTGIVEELRQRKDLMFHDGFNPDLSREENMEERRKGLIADLFFTGINAVSVTGSLHWLDMVGNRIAPLSFGPKRVVLLTGKNKLVSTPEDAVKRIKEIAAPQNVARHPGFNTPCAKTGKCHDCNSPQRICNAWLTIERCFPKGRILVILIDEELGL